MVDDAREPRPDPLRAEGDLRATSRAATLATVVAVTALGALGLAIGADAWSVLAWLALAAPAAGHLVARAASTRRGTFVAWCAPPVLWALLVVALASRSAAPPAWPGALAVCGLYALGLATGRVGRSGAAGAGVWLAALALLAGAPMGWGVVTRPWPPEIAAFLLDLSPLSVVLESAGADWMRHPAVYDPAGTLDIGPQMRVAWRGTLAGPGLLVLGCAALGAAVVSRPRSLAPARKDS